MSMLYGWANYTLLTLISDPITALFYKIKVFEKSKRSILYSDCEWLF